MFKSLIETYLKVDKEETDFMPERLAASHRGAKMSSHLLLIMVAVSIFFALVWATFAKVDEVTRGQGKIVTSSRVQTIGNQEGGIVKEIMVREGQTVEKDQVLLVIDNTMAEADYKTARNRYMSLYATISRLTAEFEGKPLAFPKELIAEAPDAVTTETNEYETRRLQLRSQLDILESQARQKQDELSQFISSAENIRKSLEIASQQMNIVEKGVAQGVSAKMDLLNLQRERSELELRLDSTQQSIPRARSALAESRQRIEDRKLQFRTEVSNQLNTKRQELSALTQSISASRDRVERREVKSPVRGIVKQLKVGTVGGVIKPGEDLVEVIPVGDNMLVEARIRPADIAFIRPNQDATVKITAYDFAIYGGLKAQVREISPDTITDERGESFYVIKLETTGDTFKRGRGKIEIIPGMTAIVDIKTGQKTILEYILKPFFKARDNALRER